MLEQNGMGFPFDYHFTFFFIAVCAAGVGVILYFLPTSIDRRATEDDVLS